MSEVVVVVLDSPSRPSKVARGAGQTCAAVVVPAPPADEPVTPTAPAPSTAAAPAAPATAPAAPAAVGAFRDETCGMELEMDWDW